MESVAYELFLMPDDLNLLIFIDINITCYADIKCKPKTSNLWFNF